MSETTTAPALYDRAISRAVWFRQAETKCRFLFAPDDPEGLVIAPVGPKGRQSIMDAAKRLHDAGHKITAGAMLVDGDGDMVFCLAGEPAPFLSSLATWAEQRVAAIPALGTLKTAGAARLLAPLDNDAAIEALDLETLAIVREPAVWQALLRTDDASVAGLLGPLLPGERIWFWMSDDVPGDMVPLLIQPVSWDPNRDRLDTQIRQLKADGAGEGVTGYAYFTEDGLMQFVAGALSPPLMDELAAWVSEQMTVCPALTRLANCQFIRTEGGIVIDVLEDPELWSDIVAPPAPGTLPAATAALAELAPGASLWLWLTANTPEGGFLALSPVAADEQGEAFRSQVAGFYRRFPESYQDARTGMVSRNADGGLRIAWHGEGALAVAQALAAIIRRESGLLPLADAVLAEETR